MNVLSPGHEIEATQGRELILDHVGQRISQQGRISFENRCDMG
jgi:hypothetical protein